jgi:hypothetical protein
LYTFKAYGKKEGKTVAIGVGLALALAMTVYELRTGFGYWTGGPICSRRILCTYGIFPLINFLRENVLERKRQQLLLH